VASVTLESVSKSFRTKRDEVRAVCGLNLHVADREFVVLVGPSGCGKTTTLRLIAGLDELDAGTIRIGDRVVNRVEPKDRDVAMVFQSYALYPHMTVHKNLAFGLKMRRVPRADIQQRVAAVAQRLDIEALLDRKPAALSGGEQQRVALGRAIVRTPNVFLLDEPLSNLDARLRLQMRMELKTLHRDLNATIIHVTHDQEEAMTLGNRIVVLKGGTVQQCGPPLDVYDAPANRFVAGFLGTPPMNFVDGKIMHDGTAATFASPLGQLPLPAPPRPEGGFRDGQSVVLGVRPEHVRLMPPATGHAPSATPDALPLAEQPWVGIGVMRVLFVEPLGHSKNVHVVTGSGERLTACATAGTAVRPEDTVTVSIDTAHCHVFEPGENGRRLG